MSQRWSWGSRGVFVGLLVFLLAIPASAGASSPLKIKEAFPGSTGTDPKAEFVELQMTAAGQNDVDGQVLRFYDATGAEVPASNFTIPSDVANGQSQRTVLLATSEAGVAADFTLSSVDRMDPAGGAVCFTGPNEADCLTWGSIPLFELLSGFPDRQTANAVAIADEQSLHRDITRGCATLLDSADDTNSGAADFDLGPPSPRKNSVTPTEIRCPPTTAILSGPDSPTNKTTASLTYAPLPNEPGASFQCHLDTSPSATPPATPPTEVEWEACDTQPRVYTSLSDGFYRFWARTKGENPAWGPPSSRAWQLDATAPETQITAAPPEPSSGFEASFGFSSSEEHSSFRCQLDDGAIQVCAVNATAGTKSYFNLTDGTHTFRAWATDNAENKDPTPAERTFTVFTPLGDSTPPDTSIISAPSNPSSSSSAFFAYASSEPGSSFQCRLGNAAFAACPDTGVRYEKLKNGTYTFEVRAIDRAANTDSIPAAATWRVGAPLPNTTITAGPPGRVLLPKGAKGKRAILLRFKADKPGSEFRCALNGGKPKPCGKKKRIVLRKPGRYRFEVFAIDSLGNVETTPARRIWKAQRRGRGGLFG